MLRPVGHGVNTTSTRVGDGRARRWEAHRAHRRAELVSAAIVAIERHGPEVRTEQIAAAAGLPRPKLYRHFDGKADLQRAVVERAVELLDAELRPALASRGAPTEMISTAIDTHLRWLSEHPDLYRYVLRCSRDRQPDSPDRVAGIRATIAGQVADLLTGPAAAVTVPAAVAAPLAAGLVGFVDAAADRWLDDPNGLSRARLTEYLTSWSWTVVDTALREQSGSQLCDGSAG